MHDHTPCRRSPARLRGTLALALLAAPAFASAAAQAEVAAEQILTETNSNTHVGGWPVKRFAQVFELPEAGGISHVMLPAACDPQATLRVTIERAPNGVPDGRVVAQQDVPGYVLDAVQVGAVVSSMRMVEFTRLALLKPGLYAFTLDTLGSGDCALWRAPPGTPYAYLAYSAAPSGKWQPLVDAIGRPQALAFQVFYRPR